MAAAALALLFGWPAKVIPVTFGLTLALAWFWRLGFADKVLWSVESWTGKDLDHDGQHGPAGAAIRYSQRGDGKGDRSTPDRRECH